MEFEYCNLEDNIPKTACVYFLMNDIELCYIGSAINLKRRIRRHNNELNPGIYLGNKLLVPNYFNSIYYIKISNKKERIKLEYQLIEEFMPKWNYQGIHTIIDYRCVHPDSIPFNYR